MEKNILDIKDLSIDYTSDGGIVHAVDHLSLSMRKSETLGLVGETGAGKTTTALSIMQLIQSPPGKVVGGEILYEGENLLTMKESQLCHIRGNQISMIFQDPMTALNPVMRVGKQIAEVINLHEDCGKKEAMERALQMLEKVGIPAYRGEEFPYQFSGGMKQRVVIAMALACMPHLLIADEPTTALDVSIQAQILTMMNELKSEMGTSILLITHDLGVVAQTCDSVAVIYAGQVVEYGTLEDVFERTAHPYTLGLFNSLPNIESKAKRLKPIPGLMPDPTLEIKGCKFCDRCPNMQSICGQQPPPYRVNNGHCVRCHFDLVKM